MSRTISNTVTATVTLTATANPLSITSSGTISAASGYAIYGGAEQSWQIINAGLVQTSPLSTSASEGIYLRAGGTVTNTGTIIDTYSSAETIVIEGGAGSVSNTGNISGAFDGAVLADGGNVTNSGTISGTLNTGVFISGGAATLSNAGRIVGGTYAVQFVGNEADRLIIDPGAQFVGVVQGGSGTNTMELAQGSGTLGRVSNLASDFRNFGTILVDSNADWRFDSTDTVAAGILLADSGTLTVNGLISTTLTIANGGSLVNTGTLDAGSAAYAITIAGGGLVTNTGATATIEGSRYGIRAGGEAATVVNTGIILGTSGADGGGIGFYAGGSITNSGTIAGLGDFGVYIDGGAGTLTNAGTIKGALGAVAFQGNFADRLIIDPGAVFVGKVGGGTGSNVLELAAGSIAHSTGTISGLGTNFVDFGSLDVDAGATWQLAAGGIFAAGGTVTDSGILRNAGEIDSSVTVANAGSFNNTGTVNSGTVHYAVALQAGGIVTNTGSAALISGYRFGVYGTNAFSSITNSGTILTTWIGGGGVGLFTGGSVANTGVIAAGGDGGVLIEGGIGAVTNSGSIYGPSYGVWLAGGGTVINTGTIRGGRMFGVYLGRDSAGRLILAPGAVVQGGVQGGAGSDTLELAPGSAGSTGTLSAFNTQFSGFDTIDVDSTGAWLFDSTDTIASSMTLTDAGTLSNTGLVNTTVTVANGGSFRNTGTVDAGMANAGVLLLSGGAVANVGTGALIAGSNYGIRSEGAASVGNDGTIVSSLADKGEALRIDLGSGIVTNTGTILGAEGVALTHSGSVYNSGTIIGTAGLGVYIGGGAGTLTNAGSIGGGGEAVVFSGGFDDRVVLYPGAAFGGVVFGGFRTNTLELAAGTLGSVGTLNGFSTGFSNFDTITVDSGATWLFGAGNVIGTGISLTDAGVLNNGGTIDTVVTVANAGSFGNTGTVNGLGGVVLVAGGVVSNSGSASLIEGQFYGIRGAGAAASVTNSGTIIGSSFGGVELYAGGSVFNAGRISDSFYGVYITGSAGTVTNTGSIYGLDNISGVALHDGGEVINGIGTTTAAVIKGSSYAVRAVSNSATIVNNGYLGANIGIGLAAGGIVSNSGLIATFIGGIEITGSGQVTNTGTIASGSAALFGVSISGSNGTVVNEGSIIDGVKGVVLADGGTVINSGSIFGDHIFASIYPGVYIGGGPGTVINSGMIGSFVQFSGTYADRLVLYPGAVLQGGAQGGRGTNTLELRAGTAGGIGTISNFGSAFTQFGTIIVDGGAKWELDGNPPNNAQTVTLAGTGDILAIGTPGSFTDIIANFGSTDTLDLTGLTYQTGATAIDSNSTLTVTSGDVKDIINLNRIPPGTKFVALDDGRTTHGTLIEELTPCYCRGTHILTDRGEVAVEQLRVGDRIVTFSGQGPVLKPILWIGHRRFDAARHPRPQEVWPVRIRQHAFAQNVPHRDLLVSPRHAVLIDGVLIQSDQLINGATIIQDRQIPTGIYFHIELAAHDILLSEGLPAETYLDNGNRGAFANGGVCTHLRPDFKPAFWRDTCVRLVTEGDKLTTARAHLLARAYACGYVTTHDPDLRLITETGRSVAPVALGERRFLFVLPSPGRVRLVSRSFVPAHQHPGHSDGRSLGVCVTGLQIDDRPISDLQDPGLLRAGWYEVEGPIAAAWRWTDGDATISFVERHVTLCLAGEGRYWQAPPIRIAAARAAS